MIERMILISSLTLIIHAAETLSYAVRMAGIRTGKLAIALSLTGMIVLVSRTSNIAQGTMTGKIVDLARQQAGIHLIDSFRIILLAASIGTLIAIALYPSVVALSGRMVAHLEQAGSIPRMAKKLLGSRRILNFFYYLRMPKWEMARRILDNGLPKRFMLMNCGVTAIYTVGVLAALYASYLPGHYSTGASQASGLINGLATIMLTLLIDPHVALLTDKVLRREAKLTSINGVFGALMLSRLGGTLLAQLILLPAAYWIKSIVPFL
ncbi:DUF2837 family protein [Paenibacillus rhizovicinus]|uniref:Lipid II flippase Amj n=1 Tax=Paenibacillus rhizovicinus TaxID=2704463 RepID=A0A6C0NU00_9BACL|nr:lipid II flippase Amj family protein [Paenibacillus rhizovicinus]QHW29655.1 DUF2837 family protein [Paenibacillus rhizovicinus]